MKNNVDAILYEVFGYDIKYSDRQSFICFLKLCGAYDSYMKNISKTMLKGRKDGIHEKDSLMAFYFIISCSFIWSITKDGYDYWSIVSALHKIIINIKIKKNLIIPNQRLIQYLLRSNSSIHYEMEKIDYILSEATIKDRRKGKKLNMFISKLKEYCEENNLL